MKVKNTGARLYILGDATEGVDRTRLMPGQIVESDRDLFRRCIERGIAQGKPFKILEDDSKAKSKPAKFDFGK